MAYTKLFSLPKDQYCPTSPLVIAAGALLKDEKTGSVVAQLKLRSISPDVIIAVQVKITAFDVSGQQLPQEKEYQYLDLQAMRGEEFGQKQAIVLPDKTARSFAASCVSIVLKKGTNWTVPEGGAWTSLPKQESLGKHLGYGLTEQYKRQTTAKAEFVPLEHEDLWLCACGAINHSGEKNCCRCRSTYADLVTALNKETLSEKKKAHDSAAAKEKAEQQEKEAARKKQTAKIAAIVGSVVAVVIVFLIVLNSVIIPNIKYNNALKLYNNGQYDEAIAAFTAMEGYKDSADQIKNCKTGILDNKYNDAVALMDAGSYEEAIAAFTALDGYKDSAEQITTCETAIMDGQYNDAVALMDAGNYEEAITAFTALGSHRDSKEQITNCETAIMDSKYNDAVALMDAEKTIEAYEALIALDGYKDSAAKADSIYEEYKSIKLKNAKVGDYVIFGSYEQNNDAFNGKEKIEWLVLDVQDGKALVISRYGLDCQPYNTEQEGVTWETCTLRSWLNNDFVSTAFSAAEQSRIPTVTVSADKNPDYSTNPVNATQDRVFLLSIDEANKYFSSDSARQCQPTAYANAQGAYAADNGNCLWWLRSPGFYQDLARIVSNDGDGHGHNCRVDDSIAAVRPALWIDMTEK